MQQNTKLTPKQAMMMQGRGIFDDIFGGGSKDLCGESDSSGMDEALWSGANDVIVIRQADGSLWSTPINVHFGNFTICWFDDYLNNNNI